VTKAYFTFFFAAALLYLVVSLVSNFLIGRVEARSKRGMPSLKEAR